MKHLDKERDTDSLDDDASVRELDILCMRCYFERADPMLLGRVGTPPRVIESFIKIKEEMLLTISSVHQAMSRPLCPTHPDIIASEQTLDSHFRGGFNEALLTIINMDAGKVNNLKLVPLFCKFFIHHTVPLQRQTDFVPHDKDAFVQLVHPFSRSALGRELFGKIRFWSDQCWHNMSLFSIISDVETRHTPSSEHLNLKIENVHMPCCARGFCAFHHVQGSPEDCSHTLGIPGTRVLCSLCQKSAHTTCLTPEFLSGPVICLKCAAKNEDFESDSDDSAKHHTVDPPI